MPIDVERTTRSHSLKLIASIALVIMAFTGLTSCGGGGSGSGSGNQVTIIPLPSPGESLLQGEPDLVVASPSVSTGSPAAGAAFRLSATVSNTGDVESPATTLRFYRSTDATITTADTAVGTDPVGALAAAGTIAESISLTAPSSPGTYYYGACVDAVIGESDTTNNCTGSVLVTVPETQRQGAPDLVVASPSVSAGSPAAGAPLTLSATVSNTGDGESLATTLRFYRSTDATITTADTVVGTDPVGALAAAGTISQSISLTAPSSPGTYYYGACVDAVTGESDTTTNNCSGSVQVTVPETQQQGVPDLVVASPSVSPDSPAAGAAFTLSATMRNDGNGASLATTLRYYRSTDATITTADTVVGTDPVSVLAAAGTIAQSISLTAPSSPGAYYYGACVDAVTGRVRHHQQLFVLYRGNRSGNAAAAGRSGPGGGIALGERRQPGRRGGVHAVGDDAERRGRRRCRYNAALLPLNGRDDHDGGHGGGDGRGERVGGGRHHRTVDLADGALDTRRILLRRLRRCGDGRVRHHQQLFVLYRGNRSGNAAANSAPTGP